MRMLYPHRLTGILFGFWLTTISFGTAFAQKAVAELISTMPPAVGDINYTDGIRQIRFLRDHLLITNFWAGLQVVDISDIQNPRQVGSFATSDQAYYTDVNGDYAYLANQSSGVRVYNIADLNNVTEAGQIKTPGNAFWVVAEFPRLFVALGDAGFCIMDITNFASPITLKLEIPQAWIQQIFKKGNLLFLAAKKGGIFIYDVSDLENPVKLSQFRTGYNAMKVQVVDDIAFIADGAGGLLLINISNPAFPVEIKRFTNVGFVGDLYKAGSYVYLANRDIGLQIVNVSDPERPFLESRYATEDISYGVYKQDIYVFLAANTSTLIMRHNNAPRLTDIIDPQLYENQAFSLQIDAQEPDGDPILYEIENLPEGATFDTEKGFFSWMPTYEQSGEYRQVIYRVIEQTETSLSASDTVTLYVNHVNRIPDLPAVDNQLIDEQKNLGFVIPAGSDPDREDQERIAYRAENLPEGARFDAASRTFSWVPSYEQSGEYVVDFLIDDGGGGIDREPITIAVKHIDRKPVIDAIPAQKVDEAQTLGVGITGTELDVEDQDKISYRMYNLPQGATFDATSATFEWNPTYDQSGLYKDIMAVMVAGELSDTTLFAVEVQHVNRKPELTIIPAQAVDENKPLTFSVSGSDPDVEDDGKLTFSASNLPEGAVFDAVNRTFSWTPTYEQAASYENIVFTLTDPSGLMDSKNTSIKVAHVNRAPSITSLKNRSINEAVSLDVQLTASDPDREDKDGLVFSMTGAPDGAVLDANTGTFNWTPNYDQSGDYRLVFTVSDNQYSDTTSLKIAVAHVNRAPQLDAIADVASDENQLISFSISGQDSDVEDTGKLVFASTGLPEGATFDPASRVFNWTPNFEQSGTYQVGFSISDPGGLSSKQTITLDIRHVNRTPTLEALAAIAQDENKPVTFQLAGSDPDAEDTGKLVYELDNLPEGAQLNATSGSFSWTPTFDQSGSYTLTARVRDADGLLSEQVTKLTINNVNRPPVFPAIASQNGVENEALQINAAASDPDREDEGKLTYAATGLPAGAQLNPATGTLLWTPGYEQSGSYSAGIKVTDSFGASDETTINITIAHVNRSPELATISDLSHNEGEPFSLVLPLANDPDGEDEVVYVLKGLPEGAGFDAASRTLQWTPGFEQAGEYTFSYTAGDGSTEVKREFKLVVNNVNRAPKISSVDTGRTVKENETLTFTLEVSDPDREDQGNLTIESPNLPAGATFDAARIQFDWTPDSTQQGNYNVDFIVRDSGGLVDNTTISIQVDDSVPAPQTP